MDVYPEALLGYRAWFFKEGLRSMGLGAERWTSPYKKALCKKGIRHNAPEGDCMCGIHAFYDFQEIKTHRQGLIRDFGWDGDLEKSFAREKNHFSSLASYIVVGAIAARGKVELHWNGFRAEEVRITSFLLNGDQIKDPYLLGFGVPVFQGFDDFSEYAKMQAGQYPKALRPPSPLSEEKMQYFSKRFLSLQNEEEYQSLARALDLEPYEMGDMALHLGLPLPRW